MAVTDAEFRAAFPAYKDTFKFPTSQVTFYIAVGYKMHNPERWGNLLDFGVMLWVAHNLAMDTQGAAAGGAIRGTVTSMSADGLSWKRDLASAVDPASGHWNLSIYGLRWRNMVNLVGAGPLYVGAPSVLDMYLSGGAYGWPGPDVTVTW